MSDAPLIPLTPLAPEDFEALPKDIVGVPVNFDTLAIAPHLWPRPADDDVFSLHIRYEGKKADVEERSRRLYTPQQAAISKGMKFAWLRRKLARK